jgi:ABC-type sugar transport system substrate-binding protein
VAGASLNDGAADVARVLGDEAVVTVSFAEDADAVNKIMQADAVALVLADSASSGKQLEHAIKQLKIAGVPVLGCVFVTKK